MSSARVQGGGTLHCLAVSKKKKLHRRRQVTLSAWSSLIPETKHVQELCVCPWSKMKQVHGSCPYSICFGLTGGTETEHS